MSSGDTGAAVPAFRFRVLGVGDPAPYFKARCTSNDVYTFDSAAGRFIVLAFVGSSASGPGNAMVRIVEQNRFLFNDDKIALFYVTSDSSDETGRRLKESMPGIRVFWDFNGEIAQLYGSLPIELGTAGGYPYRPQWVVLDPNLRVRGLFDASPDGGLKEIADFLKKLPAVDLYCGFSVPVPIIVLPNVFEPEFCRELVSLYEQNGGVDSGFMIERNGVTTSRTDYNHKRRRDFTIEDDSLKVLLQKKVHRRVVPEIQKVHQFIVTRMERYIVACYDSEDRAHFNSHRDNTTKGTAHRRFALSINLNSEFEGGEVCFPEYGSRTFKAPPGGAVVFSCSLLHKVTPVTSGRRYAFLPFLYDDAAAELRARNNPFLDASVGEYILQN